MEMTFDRREHVLCATVTGRLDGETTPRFDAGLREAVRETDRYLIVDLAGVAYMNSSGLRVILAMAKQLKAQGGRALVCGLSTPLHQMFTVSGFDKVIHIAKSRERAFDALSGRGGTARQE